MFRVYSSPGNAELLQIALFVVFSNISGVKPDSLVVAADVSVTSCFLPSRQTGDDRSDRDQ